MCIFPFEKELIWNIIWPTYLKSDTSSGDMNEKIDHWLDPIEKFHKKYIIIPLQSLNSSSLEESFSSLFDNHQISLIKKIKQEFI